MPYMADYARIEIWDFKVKDKKARYPRSSIKSQFLLAAL